MSLKQLVDENPIEKGQGRDTVRLKTMNMEYTEETAGFSQSEAVIHVFGRTENGEQKHVGIEGFYPYFYIKRDEFDKNIEDIHNDSRTRSTKRDTEFETLHNEPLSRITTVLPTHVEEMRDNFDDHYEADVFFTDRYLITEGIKVGMEVPDIWADGEPDNERIHYSEIEPLTEEECPSIKPLMLSLDIEVKTENGMPDVDDARLPVTAISAHDNYTDKYRFWVLRHSNWENIDGFDESQFNDPENLPDDVDEAEVKVFDKEVNMLDDLNQWIANTSPDIMTGWNAAKNEKSNGFDFPYLINRSMNINAWNIRYWTPMHEFKDKMPLFVTKSETAVAQGIQLFDMMMAYEKTQVHELNSYSLDNVSEKELGYGKEPIDDIDYAWEHEPLVFSKYSIRDTQAVVEVEKSQEILDMYDHLRYITGQSYDECNKSNISMIDMLFLRDAYQKGIGLPTSEKPERGWYYGAKVFDPEKGKHKNAVYFDLASLYPTTMIDLNASPETVVEDSKDNHNTDRWSYIDNRSDAEKRDSDPMMEKIRYRDVTEKEGFIRDTVSDLIDMKYEYSGTDKYGAVKRITNSAYGVIGDSNSFGTGFRLFDWRIAESITLAGRRIIEYSADKVIEELHARGYTEARIIGGDTDSAVVTVPSADSIEEILEVCQEAAEAVNESYHDYMEKDFNVYDTSQEIEVESIAESIFIPKAKKGDGASKKRYSQLIVWNDDDGFIDNPTPKSKGFELVRSDSAPVTGDVQTNVLQMILEEENPKDSVYEYISTLVEKVETGDIDLEYMAIPSAISSKEPTEYGSVDRRPQPHVRGAKYANQNIQGEKIGKGVKPYMLYVDRIRASENEYPNTFTAETAEDGDVVDALTIMDLNNWPDEFIVDTDRMINRTIKSPIEVIINTMGWTWKDINSDGTQSGIADFM